MKHAHHVSPLRLSRRALLRGAGKAAIALPWLEAMRAGRANGAPVAPPPRLAFLYLGTGWNTRELFPKTRGPKHETTRLLRPLEAHRGAYTVLRGMFLEFGGGHDGDNTFLTGSDAIQRPRAGKEYKNSISCDQVAARVLGRDTRFPSLELSEQRGTGFGSQGLATIAWSAEGVPRSAESDPHAIFERLFGADGAGESSEQARRFRQRRSLLDGMTVEARALSARLGTADRERFEQYLTSLREVERQLQRELAWAKTPKPPVDASTVSAFRVSMDPGASGFDYRVYARLMYDLIALAWQTDSTRVVTYVVRRELRGAYPGIVSTTDYHSLSHHGEDPAKLDELARIDTIYMEHFAAFLARLNSIKEGDGTLLDRCLIGVGSGMGMGHSRNELPTLVAGGAKLGLRHAGFWRSEADVPLANLWATMLARAGVPEALKLRGCAGLISDLV